MEELRTYLIAIVAVCMLAAVAAAMVKNPAIARIVRFVGGILIALTVITPLLSMDFSAISADLSLDAEFDTREVEEKMHAQLSANIKRTTEAYIEAKAAELGAAVQATVTLTDETYPQPASVTIVGTLDAEQLLALSLYLSDALGIPEGKQEWK